MAGREDFLANVRQLTGRDPRQPVNPPEATGLFTSDSEAAAEAERARTVASERGTELFDDAEVAAVKAGWKVHRLDSLDQLANRVIRICRERDIRATLSSGHDVLERADLNEALNSVKIDANVLRGGDADTKPAAFSAGAGITGADWFIAESGTLVLHPRESLSRLVSLAPPIHIAVIEPGQVLPSLDELFAIERAASIDGTLASSVNLISGPSRTGDIEATIVTGIHGPIETHLVMIG